VTGPTGASVVASGVGTTVPLTPIGSGATTQIPLDAPFYATGDVVANPSGVITINNTGRY
jgi:hypothetical protein